MNNSKPFVSAIIVAGGNSTRMGGVDKCFHSLNDKMVIVYSVELFEKLSLIDEIIIVTREDKVDFLKQEFKHITKLKSIALSGEVRHDSVYSGVRECSEQCDFLLIHDAARPLIDDSIVRDSLRLAFEKKAVIVAVESKDTVKQSFDGEVVNNTPNRSTLYNVQTPQIFLKDFWVRGCSLLENPTDDSQLIEALGEKVYIAKGSYQNIKITTAEDLIIAEAFLKFRKEGEKI